MNPLKKLKLYRQNSLNQELIEAVVQDSPLSVYEALIKKGADIHAVDSIGRNVFDYAWPSATVAFFLDRGVEFSSERQLHFTALRFLSDKNIFARIMDQATDINYTAQDRNPILLSVVRSEYAANLVYLLEKKADVNVQGGQLGNTPLHQAIIAENVKAVHLLLKHGARFDIANIAGDTAVDTAQSAYAKTESPCYRDMLAAFNIEVPLPKSTPMTGKTEMSFVDNNAELDLTLTKIFNFKEGVYREIIYSNKTKTQSSTLLPFDALQQTRLLVDAETAFVRQGGIPEYSLKKRLDKM